MGNGQFYIAFYLTNFSAFKYVRIKNVEMVSFAYFKGIPAFVIHLRKATKSVVILPLMFENVYETPISSYDKATATMPKTALCVKNNQLCEI